jgi:aspartate racemase
MNTDRIAGVMGGMGPDATVDFMAKVIALNASERDQDHVHMIVDQDPTVPNRRDAIAGDAGAVAAVTEHLARMAKRLEDAGADFLVMVCNTAHVFLDGVHAVTTIPFISIIDTTIAEIENRCPETRIVGVMATDGCLDAGIYQRAVEASGRIALVPDAASKARLMSLINRIKAGDQGPDVAAAMQAVAQSLVDAGADVIIGGCTEIPIVFEGDSFSVPVISSTNVLAQKTVDLANGLQALPVK